MPCSKNIYPPYQTKRLKNHRTGKQYWLVGKIKGYKESQVLAKGNLTYVKKIKQWYLPPKYDKAHELKIVPAKHEFFSQEDKKRFI